MTDSEECDYLSLFHASELDNLKKAHDAGVVIAVPAALDYCLENDLVPPSWLVQAAVELLCDLLKREKSTKRGRSAGAIARHRQDMIDLTRWDSVVRLQEDQQRSRKVMSTYPTCPSAAEAHIYAEEVAKAEWLGSLRWRIFQCASEMLERTEAFGSPESFKRSYRQVERCRHNPSLASRYYLLPEPFLAKLGIRGDLGYGRRAKIRPWRTSPLCAPRKTAPDRSSPASAPAGPLLHV